MQTNNSHVIVKTDSNNLCFEFTVMKFKFDLKTFNNNG